MRFIFFIFIIVLLVIFLAISYVPVASATYESAESQQQLPFCDEQQTQQIDRNAG